MKKRHKLHWVTWSVTWEAINVLNYHYFESAVSHSAHQRATEMIQIGLKG